MNQLIKQDTIDLSALIKNNTTLSINGQSKTLELIREQFSEKEVQWYIINLYMYMHYHPTNDFPINLEDACKIAGFAHKANAKRTLLKNFSEDTDYKIVFLRRDENPELGGRPEETIMLNIDTFKNLCMITKSEESKKVRKYYIKLENIHNQVIKEELQEKDKLIEEKENIIEQKQDKINLLTCKTDKFNPGESVYILHFTIEENNKIIDIYKCGRTKNTNTRDSNHKSANFKGILLQISCINSSLLERIIHFLLDKYRIASNREWFNCSYNIMKNAIEYAKLVVESEINFEHINLIRNTTKFINTINILKEIKEEEEKENPNLIVFTKLEYNKLDIDNFELFLQEHIEYDDNSTITYMMLKDQYKIWSKTANTSQLKKLINYCKTKFTTVMKQFNPLVSTSKVTHNFKNIKLKDKLFKFENPNNEQLVFENYLYQNLVKNC